jgi:hypothetical protein
MFKHAADFVGTTKHRQSAQFTRAITNWTPASQVVVSALKVNKVLMCRRGVFGVFWKPKPRNLLRKWHHLAIHYAVENVHDFWAVCYLMEGVKLVNLMVNVGVSGIAFGGSSIYICDSIKRIGPLYKPASSLHQGQHLLSQIYQFVSVQQAAEKKIPIVSDSPAKFRGIVYGFVGF